MPLGPFGRRARDRVEPTNLWYRIGMTGVGYPMGGVFKLRYRGLENLPRTGGVIIAANHISYADPIVVGRFVYDQGRLPRYLAKDSLFELPAVGPVMRGMGQVPVHRGGPDAQKALSSAVAALRAGQVIIVYPEGTVTRDPDFWPSAGKTGVARLALQAPEIPVIPVGQWGAQVIDVYHKSFKVLPRREATVVAGPPIDLASFRERAATRKAPGHELLQSMTEAIMAAVTTQVEAARGEKRPG